MFILRKSRPDEGRDMVESEVEEQPTAKPIIERKTL